MKCAMCKNAACHETDLVTFEKIPCCGKDCHRWCARTTKEYLYKCPLCFKSYNKPAFDIRLEWDDWFGAHKKTNLFEKLYSVVKSAREGVRIFCCSIPRFGEMHTGAEQDSYNHYVKKINDALRNMGVEPRKTKPTQFHLDVV